VKSEKILKTFIYNGQGLLQTGALGQLDSSVVCNSVSESGQRRVIVRKVEKDNFLELYDVGVMVLVKKLDFIGKFVANGLLTRKPVLWSGDERKFLFVSERESKDGDYFNEKEAEALKGLENFKYKHTFGEGCDHYNLDINVMDFSIDAEVLKVIGIPANVIPRYPDFVDLKGESLVFAGNVVEPNEFSMGIGMCNNKKQGIWLLDGYQTESYKDERRDDQHSKPESEPPKTDDDSPSPLKETSQDAQ
jgi:hypothetical protein